MSEILAIAVTLLRTLANAPASSSFLTPHVDTILSTIAALLERGEAAVPELQALTEHIQSMVKAGTDPTAEDFATLKAKSDAAHAAIEAPAATTTAPNPDAITGVGQ
jgi:hypothetical protein